MKKVIILLLLAIGFVMMILISWMKFQTTLDFRSDQSKLEYQAEDPNLLQPRYVKNLRPFVP